MAKTAPNKKSRIPLGETVFYIFKLSASEYMLYDSSMGDPIEYGSLNLVLGKLEFYKKEINKKLKIGEAAKKIYIYKLQRDASKGWKMVEKMNGIMEETPKSSGVLKYENPKKIRGMNMEPIYFWIDMGDMNYLYDMDMGSPLYYGTPSEIKGPILTHSKNYKFSVLIFHLPPKSQKPSWKMSIKYDVNHEKEQEKLKEKKRKEETNPKPPATIDKEKDV
jgi:hypothetical protein